MRRGFVIVTAATGILLLISFLLTMLLPLHVVGSLHDRSSPFTKGWHYEDGSSADLMELAFDGGETVILHPVSGKDIDGREMCFISRNVEFSVYLDDAQIYDFHPQLSGLYGLYYGDQVHTVSIPYFEGSSTLRFDCTATIENKWTGFDTMVLEDSGMHLMTLLRKNAGKFILCMVTFLAGLLIFILGVIEEILRKNMLEPMALGVTAMLLSIWSNFPTDVVQLMTGNFASSRVLEHVTLIILPIPILIFVASMTKNMDKHILYISLDMSILNLIGQTAAVGLGMTDYHEMLIFSHVLMLADILLVIWFIVRGITTKVISRETQFYLITSITAIFICCMVDMARYYLIDNVADAAAASRVGLFLFVSILAVYEFRQLVDMQVRSGEAEMMHQLAMEDALTGLRNRTAFSEYEQKLQERSNGMCMFVHFDVNFLKKVNDTYGHSEGDRHIIAAANVIQESFGQYGTAYRVGGDEFFVILDGSNPQKDYDRAIVIFEEKQNAYNLNEHPPVPLNIAHGKAMYRCSDHNPEVAEKIADSRMYENKRRIKAMMGANAS